MASLQYDRLSFVIVVIYLDLIPLFLILIRAFLKTSIPIATDGQVESAQISIFDSTLDKTLKIALVVFSVPYNTSVLSDFTLGDDGEEDDGGTVTYDSILYLLLYKIPPKM
jgi:hypothetical protein